MKAAYEPVEEWTYQKSPSEVKLETRLKSIFLNSWFSLHFNFELLGSLLEFPPPNLLYVNRQSSTRLYS